MAFLQCIFSDGEPDHNHEKSICHTDCIDIASPQCVLSDLLPNYISEHGTSHNISTYMTSYQCVLTDDEPDSNSDLKNCHNGCIIMVFPQCESSYGFNIGTFWESFSDGYWDYYFFSKHISTLLYCWSSPLCICICFTPVDFSRLYFNLYQWCKHMLKQFKFLIV